MKKNIAAFYLLVIDLNGTTDPRRTSDARDAAKPLEFWEIEFRVKPWRANAPIDLFLMHKTVALFTKLSQFHFTY